MTASLRGSYSNKPKRVLQTHATPVVLQNTPHMVGTQPMVVILNFLPHHATKWLQGQANVDAPHTQTHTTPPI